MITVKVDVDDDPSDEADAYRGAESGNGISNYIYTRTCIVCTVRTTVQSLTFQESYIYSFIHES